MAKNQFGSGEVDMKSSLQLTGSNTMIVTNVSSLFRL